MRAFLCHNHVDSTFVKALAQYLKPLVDGGIFLYEENQRADKSFVETINWELSRCNVMVVFARATLSKWQIDEVNVAFAEAQREKGTRAFVVCLIETSELPKDLILLNGHPRVHVANSGQANLMEIAEEITDKFRNLWLSPGDDGLPQNPHLFSYEKDVITHFFECAKFEGKALPGKLKKRQQDGCPPQWPRVPRWAKPDLKEKGPERLVVAAALSQYHQPQMSNGSHPCVRGCMVLDGPSFPEAVPRDKDSLYFPRDVAGLKVGIVVSGGIAPGINAVIDGIVQRHMLYADEGKYLPQLEILGLRNGFLAFDNLARAQARLSPVVTSDHATEGGSFLGTSRDEKLSSTSTRRERLQSIVQQLRDNRYDLLYVIGGDGSMKAAHALWTVAEEEWRTNPNVAQRRLSVVAIPKTMDNDILWVWQAFGFMSAVEKAREIIEDIGTEVGSNPRLYVVQLFGSDSGFVVSHAVLASRGRLCDAALIPEIDFSMPQLAEYIRSKIRKRAAAAVPENPWVLLPGGLVVMAETAIPTDALEYINDEKVGLIPDEKRVLQDYCDKRDRKERIQGQTDGFLRSAGLKIVSQVLNKMLQDTERAIGDPDWKRLRTFTNEPRHQLRAIRPSCTDIIFGNRLGTLAVDNAMVGYTDFMISQWLTEYVLVPLQLVVLGRKRIPKKGMFWRSVISKTGQPANLSSRAESHDDEEDASFNDVAPDQVVNGDVSPTQVRIPAVGADQVTPGRTPRVRRPTRQ